MSVAYIEPTSRTQRPGRPKLLIQRSPRSHVTRTPLSRSNGQRSRSQGRSAHRRVGASGGCSGGRGNALAVGNCCYVAVCSAAQGASAPTGEERGGAYRGGRPPTACYYYYLAKGGRYRSNGNSIIAEIRRRKKMIPGVPHFNVTQGHGSIGYL